MRNKFWLHLGVILLCMHSASTYAAKASSNSSLWGSVDEPVAPIQQIEQQQQAAEAEQFRLENLKTICELFTAQTDLISDAANASKIKEALLRIYQSTSPEYKMLIASPESANSLYVRYRDLYMQTYCMSGTGSTTSNKQ